MYSLERYEFLVYTKKQHLTLKETSDYTKGKESHNTSPNVIQTPPVTTIKFSDIPAYFPKLTKSDPQPFKSERRASNTIKTEGASVFAIPRRLSSDKPKIVRAELKYILYWILSTLLIAKEHPFNTRFQTKVKAISDRLWITVSSTIKQYQIHTQYLTFKILQTDDNE